MPQGFLDLTPSERVSRAGQSSGRAGNTAQIISCLFCFLFGLAMIAELQLTNDGGWHWYSLAFLSGRRLYADMHLALQPLFILENAAFIKLFGTSWLASKILAVIQLLAFCVALFLLARKSPLMDRQKAIVLGCAFFLSLWTVAYQFDDYHTPADCLVLYSILVLLLLRESVTVRRIYLLVASLGVLSGVAVTLRINDGLALWFGVLLSIYCLTQTKRFAAVALFIGTSALTVVLIVHLTGDSFTAYAGYSIFRAANGKGGSSHVFLYPLKLPWNSVRYLSIPKNSDTAVKAFAVAAVWAYFIWPVNWRSSRPSWRQVLGIALTIAILFTIHLDRDLILSASGFSVLLIYSLGIWVFIRYLHWEISGRTTNWNTREILLITPFGQLISTAASSGGINWGVYEPWAMFILILPIAAPVRFKSGRPRAALIGFSAMILAAGALYRFIVPYAWHSTVAKPMFIGRQWYHHPIYGPMIIHTDMLQFIKPICDQVGGPGADSTLLSLPYPYPNYFCGIPPWRGYVQTYFDTTTPADITHLINDLDSSPPRWIVYQRQIGSLTAHEVQFNRGLPLPHRELDHFISQKLVAGEWEVVYKSHFESTPQWDNEWILIRTAR